METHEIDQTNEEATGCFIFIHGADRNGENLKEEFIKLLGPKSAFPHIKVIFPTATVRYFEPLDKMTNSWFNVTTVKNYPVCSLPMIDESAEFIEGLIQQQTSKGIPLSRIVVGGISQGGILALHYVYRYNRKLAGCVAASSCLPNDHCVHDAIRFASKTLPPLLMTHGGKDEVIKESWAKGVFEKLKKLGVQGDYHMFPGAPHDFIPEQLELIYTWVAALLPEK